MRRSNPASFARRLDCFASLAMTALGMFVLLLLLLLLLLARIQHPSLGKLDRLAQHVEIADVISEHKNQRGVEIGALRFAEAAMRFHDGAKGVVGLCEI